MEGCALTEKHADSEFPYLDEEFAAYVRARGITPEIAAERGYRTVRQGKPLDGGYAAAWGFPQKMAGMLIPLHAVLDPDPEGLEKVQLRLAAELLVPDSKGKMPPKFRSPKGKKIALATAPRTRPMLSEPRQLIVICEGVTRIDALAAFGIPAVGMSGIWSWRSLTALPDWENIRIKGNRFLVVPDGDVRTNRNVAASVKRLQALLRGRGADTVHIIALPDGQGLDDWIAANDFEDADKLSHALKEFASANVPESVPLQVGDVFGIADAKPWACTPAADARRLLDYAPDKLCVVQGERYAPWQLMVDCDNGRWSLDDADVGRLHVETTLDWQRKVTAAAQKGTLNSDEATFCTKWAVKSGSTQGLRNMLDMIGPMFRYMEAHGLVPEGLTTCRMRELDAIPAMLGVKNGVVDLKSGKLLDAKVARSMFVTRTTPDDFDATAQHTKATALLAHLEAEERGYLEQAFGFALRGNPARRFYGLAGRKNGGKTTLLAAIYAALGDVKQDGYGMRLEPEAILTTGWGAGASAHKGLLVGIERARIVITEEPPINRCINAALVKDLTGGGPQSFRDVGAKAGPSLLVMGTVFMALNPGQETVLDTSEDALYDRVRLLPYPQLPEPDGGYDPQRTQEVQTNPAIRRAVLAMLVSWAEASANRPSDTMRVADFTEQRHRESIGDVGTWLQDKLVVTKSRRDRVLLRDVWAALSEQVGKPDDDGRIDGCTQKETWSLARELHPDLPRAKNAGKGLGSKWVGVKLADSAADSERTCDGCGELFNVPTEVPDAALCGECEEDAGAPPAAGASTGPAPRQGRFAGGPAPQQGSLLTHVEARLESMTVPTPTAHINPYYYPLGELWPWALAGALRGMRRAMLDNPALVPPTWVDAAWILNDLEQQAKVVGSRGGGPAGEIEQRIEQQDWATNLADLRKEVARLDAERSRGLTNALAKFGQLGLPQQGS